MTKKLYPNRLRIILADKNVTNHWLAMKMGVTDMTVSRWCTNRIQPSISQLVQQMSKLLDTEMEKFIDTSVDPE
jgi:conserved domain protein